MNPVGKHTLGNLYDVFGNNLVDPEKRDDDTLRSIHQDPVSFSQRSSSDEIFLTGIKAIDVLAPLPKGEKAGLFGGA